MDKNAYKFAAQSRTQGPRKEIIKDLKDMAKTLMIEFNKKTGYKPEKILFYRDGVSEGQFDQVRALY